MNGKIHYEIESIINEFAERKRDDTFICQQAINLVNV